eukprot:10506-Heterococcus_DN1.PRE.2
MHLVNSSLLDATHGKQLAICFAIQQDGCLLAALHNLEAASPPATQERRASVRGEESVRARVLFQERESDAAFLVART